jgi:hypothetical protein
MFLIALLFFQNPGFMTGFTVWFPNQGGGGIFTSGGWLSLLRCNVGRSTPAPNRHQNCGDWPAAGTVLGIRDPRAGPAAVWCESKHVSPAHGTYMRFSGARMPSTSHHSFNVNLAWVQCIPDCQSWPPTCCCLSPARGGRRVQQLFRNNYSARRWSLGSANSAAETDCSSEMASYRCNPSESWYGYPRSSLMGIPTQCLDTLAKLLQHGGKLSVRRCARRVQGLGYRTGLVGLRVLRGRLVRFLLVSFFFPGGWHEALRLPPESEWKGASERIRKDSIFWGTIPITTLLNLPVQLELLVQNVRGGHHRC